MSGEVLKNTFSSNYHEFILHYNNTVTFSVRCVEIPNKGPGPCSSERGSRIQTVNFILCIRVLSKVVEKVLWVDSSVTINIGLIRDKASVLLASDAEHQFVIAKIIYIPKRWESFQSQTTCFPSTPQLYYSTYCQNLPPLTLLNDWEVNVKMFGYNQIWCEFGLKYSTWPKKETPCEIPIVTCPNNFRKKYRTTHVQPLYS